MMLVERNMNDSLVKSQSLRTGFLVLKYYEENGMRTNMVFEKAISI